MTTLTACPPHVWHLHPTWELYGKPADTSPGYCLTCGEAMPAERASDRMRHDAYEQRRQANRNSQRGRTGSPGVYYHAGKQQWRAWVYVDGQQKQLGAFATEEQAVQARERAASEQVPS